MGSSRPCRAKHGREHAPPRSNLIRSTLMSLTAVFLTAGGSLMGWLGWLGHSSATAAPTATIHYLAPTGQDSGNNCRQSTTPCATLQYALDQIASGDEIWLAGGTYTAVAVRADFTQTGYISQPVAIRGGYPPTFATPPDPDLHPTTLDAQSLGRVLTISGTQEVVLANLRLMGGDVPSSVGRGGAIYLAHASLTLSNTILFSNTAEYGGGLYGQHSHLLWLDGSASDNHAGYGGAIYLQASTGLVQGVNFSANEATVGGGALRLYETPLEITDSILAENEAGVHGGAVYASRSDLELRHNAILSNAITSESQGWGGGVHLSQCAAAVLHANEFRGNTAANGGGLRLSECEAAVTNNLFLANVATSGGGLAIQGTSSPTLDNNVIADNEATAEGAGALVRDATPLWRHTTFARNTGGDGAALTVLGDSQTTLLNSLIAQQVIGIRAQRSRATAELAAVLWDTITTPTSGAVTVTGDIVGAADFSADGYHILPSSAALDAAPELGLADDVDGQPRPQGIAPDLGADELATLLALKLAPRWVEAGQTFTYTIWLTNTTQLTISAAVTDLLPAAVDYLGPVQASAGTADFAAGQISWAGEMGPNAAVSIQWPVQLPITLPLGTTITNTATIAEDGVLFATLVVSTTIPFRAYLPLVQSAEVQRGGGAEAN